MGSNRRAESLRAIRAAISTRREAGIPADQPVDPVDLAERLGVEVRFVDIGSMEGMYFVGPPATILLPSGRPAGRQAFSCAHELGHHQFGHGSKLDALVLESGEETARSDEWIADAFAAYLLMPPAPVRQGFIRRGWDFRSPGPEQVLTVAQWLGVGYSALIYQMRDSLNVLESRLASQLLKTSPRVIVRSILDDPSAGETLLLDPGWRSIPINVQAGTQLAVLGTCQLSGDAVVPNGSSGARTLFMAEKPGQARISIEGEWHFIRVSRANYFGRARYRFLSDPAG